jgi:hypothetical protein
MNWCAWWEKSSVAGSGVIEVEDGGGWNRFWVRDKNSFRGKASS